MRCYNTGIRSASLAAAPAPPLTPALLASWTAADACADTIVAAGSSAAMKPPVVLRMIPSIAVAAFLNLILTNNTSL